MDLKNRVIKNIQDIRLKITSIIKMPNFSSNIMKGVYKNYISHDKVIAWTNGLPVFSTFSPPALSKVQANMEARNAIDMMQNRKHPNMINIGVNDECNCDCVHCSFKAIKSDKRVLKTEELKKLIKDAQDLGVSTITFSGGEPLMREDLPELIKAVDKNLSVTVIFTNGWFLEENIKKLKQAGLNSINVSIDSNIPKKHDELRNKKGLFRKAVAGIIAAKKNGFIVGISVCISKEQVENGELEKIIELGKRLRVNEIIIFDQMPAGKLINRTDLIIDNSWKEKIIKIAEKYNSRYDYPGIYPYCYVKSYKGLGCAGGVTFFYVSPYGDIHPCDFNPLKFGNVLETPLYLIWDKISSLTDFNRSSFRGCKMQDPEFRKKYLKLK